MNRWAKRLGLSKGQLLDLYLDRFKKAATDLAFMYRDWDVAFGNSIRKGWFNLPPQGDAHA